MSNLDEELKTLSPLPEDLHLALNHAILMATKYQCTLVGMLLRPEPITVMVISNVKERGHDLAELFHMYGDIVEEKADNTVNIQVPRSSSGS